VGFDTSSGRVFLTKVVEYRKNLHEIERNLSLLEGFSEPFPGRELPRLVPSSEDMRAVTGIVSESKQFSMKRLVAIAPGTLWNTKRWPVGRFAQLTGILAAKGFGILLIGGKEDAGLCEELRLSSGSDVVMNLAGKLTLLQSAEAIRRSVVLVCNDSAPMHLAVAVRTPVVALFGATVPAFGFSPYGERDIVLETLGLPCRPCSIHGGKVCPIGTFECMLNIRPESVAKAVDQMLAKNEDTGELP
jgi:heptosyltransferase-2